MKLFGKELKFNNKDVALKEEIPTSLPANGGNADTVDGKHASDFLQLTNGAGYGLFPSTASTMVGNEYNLLYDPNIIVTISGTATISNPKSLVDGRLSPSYSSKGIPPDDPTVILIENIREMHSQTGGVFGWTCRYWYPSKYKIEGYDTYQNKGWRTFIDQSTIDKSTKELVIPIYQSGLAGQYTKFRITIYEASSGGIETGTDYKRWGISEIFFINPEAMRCFEFMNADLLDGKHASEFSLSTHSHTKSQITDFPTIPTKMSQLENDIGAGGGTNIVTSATRPTGQEPGRIWIQLI